MFAARPTPCAKPPSPPATDTTVSRADRTSSARKPKTLLAAFRTDAVTLPRLRRPPEGPASSLPLLASSKAVRIESKASSARSSCCSALSNSSSASSSSCGSRPAAASSGAAAPVRRWKKLLLLWRPSASVSQPLSVLLSEWMPSSAATPNSTPSSLRPEPAWLPAPAVLC